MAGLTPVMKGVGIVAILATLLRLDQLYIPTRYPNGLPGGVPAEVFSQEQAAEAIGQATPFIERATDLTM